MGLLKKLSERKAAGEISQRENFCEQSAVAVLEAPAVVPLATAPSPAPSADQPFTCPTCSSSTAWESTYDRKLRCPTCEPAPFRAAVRRLLSFADELASQATQQPRSQHATTEDDTDLVSLTPEALDAKIRAAFDRFETHPRLVEFQHRGGNFSWSITPRGYDGDQMIKAGKERARTTTTVKPPGEGVSRPAARAPGAGSTF